MPRSNLTLDNRNRVADVFEKSEQLEDLRISANRRNLWIRLKAVQVGEDLDEVMTDSISIRITFTKE